MKLTRKALLSGVAAIGLAFLPAASQADKAVGPVEGLWNYTGLTSSSGVDMPLTGIFLLADGKFLQQAVFHDGGPAPKQAMAHTGTYTATDKGIELQAGQTLSLAPAGGQALADAGATTHALDVTREGDAMTLVFGSGTVQTLEKIGDADEADIYPLENGMLAFTGGYFILVDGNAERAVTGYGTYRQEGGQLLLEVIRWAESAEGLAQNLRDVTLTARFDGQRLVLADGRIFEVQR
ncbi:hypothetical protein [Parahaliea mediterranea]|uniref:Lipocalin-like domain-containing protein n=1 Tax=Parahaliea mediterranea TaxID=651086 RepID=A0A939IKL9_9GAMM|nr:hypothetical protein [Parahaliea mediterranea]MBN7795585.1 hypothetical protein [Parahaliea mediterranea]